MDGWMVAIEDINLPLSSPFRDPNQVPLLENPPTEVQTEEQLVVEEEDSLSMQELVEQIESHIEVIDLHIPNLPIAPKGTKVARATLGLVPLVTTKTPVTPLAIRQNSLYKQLFAFMCILIGGVFSL